MKSNNFVMWETPHNHAGWDCFKTLTFVGDLEDSKSESERLLCFFWKSYISSNNLMRMKQTSVSHSSTEAEIISLDAGLRMDGIPALAFGFRDWSVPCFSQPISRSPRIECRETCCVTPHQTSTPKNQTKGPIQHDDLGLCNVDYVSSNVTSSQFGAMLHTFEAAVIIMIIKGRSPAMRHVTRTHIFAGWQK